MYSKPVLYKNSDYNRNTSSEEWENLYSDQSDSDSDVEFTVKSKSINNRNIHNVHNVQNQSRWQELMESQMTSDTASQQQEIKSPPLKISSPFIPAQIPTSTHGSFAPTHGSFAPTQTPTHQYDPPLISKMDDVSTYKSLERQISTSYLTLNNQIFTLQHKLNIANQKIIQLEEKMFIMESYVENTEARVESYLKSRLDIGG